MQPNKRTVACNVTQNGLEWHDMYFPMFLHLMTLAPRFAFVASKRDRGMAAFQEDDDEDDEEEVSEQQEQQQ